jgi:rfaE bifunctional protein nucleotidyltransferase chain/domain
MKLVFTNGCFDVLHPGHVDLLERAKALGDRLVVGLNSDASVRAVKGPGRPIYPQEDRVLMLRALRTVDEVIVFDEPTPARLIEELAPDVLVKGGDWPVDKIVGAQSVLRRGGRVLSLPFRKPYSTTALTAKLAGPSWGAASGADTEAPHGGSPLDELAEAADLYRRTLVECGEDILAAGRILKSTLAAGGTVFFFGIGPSASCAAGIASGFAGVQEAKRKALPALALTNDSSVLTSIGNDRGPEFLFSRQIEALAKPGDCAVAICPAGTSPAVLAGVEAARKSGCRTVGLTGAGGPRLASACDAAVLVPSLDIPRIEEAHLAIGHLWRRMAEAHQVDSGVGDEKRDDDR